MLDAIENATFPGGYSPKATAGDCVFSGELAARAVAFFEKFIRHEKGEWAGSPFVLQPWQRDIVGTMFGWVRPDGTRRYRIAYIGVPRKNGKSTLCSGIALHMLFSDREPSADIFSAAADREQAAIVFDSAKRMIEMSPAMRRRATLFRRAVHVPATNATYRVLSADAHTKHGLNPHGVIFDELHAQPNRELWDVLITGRAARRQPLVVAITTAGTDRTSICWEQYSHARQVAAGVIDDPEFLPVLYEAAIEDDWESEAVWHKANPNLGVSVKLEALRSEYRRAKNSTAFQNTFRRLYLNQWTEQSVRWLDMSRWDACVEATTEDPPANAQWNVGLDLALTTDLSAAVWVTPFRDGVYLWPMFWAPRENAKNRERRDRVPYMQWARDGFLRLTDGEITDFTVIREDIKRIGQERSIREIAFDPYAATEMATNLSGDGFNMVVFRQGFISMGEPMKALERMVIGRRCYMRPNPILRWMASNVAAKLDPAGNIKPDKAKSTDRIDGIVAAIMGVGRWLVAKAEARSVYEERGLLEL